MKRNQNQSISIVSEFVSSLRSFGLILALLFSPFVLLADEPVAKSPATNSNVIMKPCYNCAGAGVLKCIAPGCANGQVECPGECLRLTRGEWIHKDVEGHPPTDLWQCFPATHSMCYSQAHVGHIIKDVDGTPTDVGACPICGGATHVACKTCDGKGFTNCRICDGKKFFPINQGPAFAPTPVAVQTNLIHLKDGRILTGRIVMVFGKKSTIRTATGDIDVATADVDYEEDSKKK